MIPHNRNQEVAVSRLAGQCRAAGLPWTVDTDPAALAQRLRSHLGEGPWLILAHRCALPVDLPDTGWEDAGWNSDVAGRLRQPDPPGTVSWRNYWLAIQACDCWWWWHWHDQPAWSRFSVLAPDRSWRGVITKLCPLMGRDWSSLEESDQKRLLGLLEESDEVWALLGRMRGCSPVFGNDATRTRIQEALKRAAHDDAFPKIAMDAYREMLGFRQISRAVATRLLAIARPDRFVSVNSGSEEGLARYVGLAPTTLGHPENYEELLRRIYRKRWFRSGEPEGGSALERKVYSMRVALLDCFVYRA